jgi:hypothetical protein
MGVTAGIFLASILLKEMRYLVYTAISIKVEQMNEFSKRFPAAFRARIRLFRFARGQPLLK